MYIGEFKDNMKDGKGTLMKCKGSKYSGYWKED